MKLVSKQMEKKQRFSMVAKAGSGQIFLQTPASQQLSPAAHGHQTSIHTTCVDVGLRCAQAHNMKPTSRRERLQKATMQLVNHSDV